jgi:hypothetical protein
VILKQIFLLFEREFFQNAADMAQANMLATVSPQYNMRCSNYLVRIVSPACTYKQGIILMFERKVAQ